MLLASKSGFVPLLAATLWALSACSASSNFNAGIAHRADNKGGHEADSGQSADPSAQDGEKSKAATPVQVAGAYLTTECGSATAADGAAATTDGTEAYGCEIEQTDHSRYAGKVEVKAITVSFADADPVSPAPHAPASASRYHVLFYISAAMHGKITSFAVSGSGTSGDGTSTVFDAAQAVQALDAGCTPAVHEESIVKIMASVGDALTARMPGFNGDAPRQLFQAYTLQAGDMLTLKEATGETLAQILPNAGVSKYPPRKCPEMWRLYFRDAAGRVLPDPLPDLAGFGAGRQVPPGAATALIGFYEPDPTTYLDNEGKAKFAAPVGTGGGCDFKFALARAKCSEN